MSEKWTVVKRKVGEYANQGGDILECWLYSPSPEYGNYGTLHPAMADRIVELLNAGEQALQSPPPVADDALVLTPTERLQLYASLDDDGYKLGKLMLAVAERQLAKATPIIEKRVLDAVLAELEVTAPHYLNAVTVIANVKKRLAAK